MPVSFVSNLKDPFSGLSHLVTAILAVFGLVYLLTLENFGTNRWCAAAIYGISLVLLFSASSIYHLVRTTPKRELLLRKIDHSAIFVFIAGTYTPICVVSLDGNFRVGLLAAVWSIAIAGVASKILIVGKNRWLTVTLYLLMGWLAVGVIGKLWNSLSSGALTFLFLGGAFYTLGAVVYATKKMDFYPGKFGFHEVWHLFVSAGAAAHYIMIAFYVLR